jgi:hypothetical protein
LLASAFHDPGFHVVAPRERQQFLQADQAARRVERAAHEERPLLPVAAKKFSRRQAAEERARHRAIMLRAGACQSKKILE